MPYRPGPSRSGGEALSAGLLGGAVPNAVLLYLNSPAGGDLDRLGGPAAADLDLLRAAEQAEGRDPVVGLLGVGAAPVDEDPVSGGARREDHDPVVGVVSLRRWRRRGRVVVR